MFDTYGRLRQTSLNYNRLPIMAKNDHAGEVFQCHKDSCCPGRLHVIFTSREKRLLAGQVFSNIEFNRVDFSHADLREALFLNVSLSESDFSEADLRGAGFIACDLRGASFARAILGRTRFDSSSVVGARGLSRQMSDYIRRNGGLLWLS